MINLFWDHFGKIVVISLVLVVLCPVTCALVRYTGDQEVATEAANEWAKKLPNVDGVECVTWDSDMDGYVSCTVYREGGLDPLYIECAGAWTLNNGCRGKGRQ